MARFLAVSLLCGSLIFQGSFPHSMGRPGVKIEYLGKANVSPAEKEAIVALVFAGLKPEDCVSFERNLEKEVDTIRIARARLGPGERNLLVQASDNCNCGGTGNCEFWILREKPDGFDTLLQTPMVQMFSVEPSRSNGHRDVVTYAHGSASYGDLTLYQFDGQKYHVTRCAFEEYEVRDNGSFSKKPTMTPTDCRNE